MSAPNEGKNPKIYFPPLTLIRIESPEQWWEREVRTWASRGLVDGCIATDALAYTARDKRWPTRLTARIIDDALRAGCGLEWAEEYNEIEREYFTRKRQQLGIRGVA